MASVVPSVLVAVAMAVALLAILGGVVQHYASMYVEPPLLPPYGAVYVESVEREGVVTVVNRFGAAVRALFVVYLAEAPPGLPSRLVPLWVELLPGVNRVDLAAGVRAALGLPEGAEVAVDPDRSYFVVGEVRYPLRPGAGLPKPPSRGRGEAAVFRASGLGVHSLGGDRSASILFDSTRVELRHWVGVRAGYHRSVYGYRVVTRTLRYDEGRRCECRGVWYYGRRWGCWFDWDCYWRCRRWCEWWCGGNQSCIERCREGCRWLCIRCGCRDAWCSRTNCFAEPYRASWTGEFECASDGGRHLYWSPELRAEQRVEVSVAALRGVGVFGPPMLAREVGGATTVLRLARSSPWPYIVGDQARCSYTSTSVRWYAAEYARAFRACDPWCGVVRLYTLCREWAETRTSALWACGGQRCASRAVFLVVELEEVSAVVSSPLSGGGSVVLELNLTYVLDYEVAEDPELADSWLRIELVGGAELALPRVVGGIGLAHDDEDLRAVWAGVEAEVLGCRLVVRTASGYSRELGLSCSVGASGALPAEVRGLGYVAAQPKAFSYRSVGRPRVELGFSRSLAVPLAVAGGDRVVVSVVITLRLTPTLAFEVVR